MKQNRTVWHAAICVFCCSPNTKADAHPKPQRCFSETTVGLGNMSSVGSHGYRNLAMKVRAEEIRCKGLAS